MADGVSEAPTAATVEVKPKVERVKVDSAPDATRTVLVRGLAKSTDDAESADLKKALYKKAKKIVAKAAGEADISVEWPLELEGEPVGASYLSLYR